MAVESSWRNGTLVKMTKNLKCRYQRHLEEEKLEGGRREKVRLLKRKRIKKDERKRERKRKTK